MVSYDASSARPGVPDAPAGVVAVLHKLEQEKATARARFDTELGAGEVDVVDGVIVDAVIGDLIGRAALFCLLGLSETSCQLTYEPMSERPALVETVEQLVFAWRERASHWRALSEDAPPLSSVLRLTEKGIAGVARSIRSPEELKLLAHVDGRHTVTDVIDRSGVDPVVALTTLIALLKQGTLLAASPEQSLFPIAGQPAGDAAVDNLTTKTPSHSTLSGVALRKRTVLGLGISTPVPPAPAQPAPAQPAPARRMEARPVISIGHSAPPKVEAVRPLRRALAAAPPAAPGPQGGETTAPRTSGPRSIGRYELLSRIAHGGMGSVYLCRVTSEAGFRRLFALKLLRGHLLKDAAAAARFVDEARLAGYLHHPNVVGVVDAGIEANQPYLVMDYVEGGSLKQLLTLPAAQKPRIIVPVILDALAGLHAAHTVAGEDGRSLNVVHCDISPENLLVGVDGVCRLTDFGVARQSAERRAPEEVTHGKPAYLSPEQILGGWVDARSDIFGMGIVLYNAITGTKLFEMPTAEATLQAVCTKRIEPPSDVGLRPPPALDFVCMKALERDPDRRYASAEEMMLDLRRIALREDWLAPSTEIANCVRQAVGEELATRRLAMLDASRRPTLETRAAAGPVPTDSAQKPGSDPPPSEGGTVALSLPVADPSPMRRYVLIAVSLVAAGIVLLTLMMPERVSRLFSLRTERYAVDQVDASLPPVESAAPPLPSAPSAAPPP
jgi:serine/threonine-protein kinase